MRLEMKKQFKGIFKSKQVYLNSVIKLLLAFLLIFIIPILLFPLFIPMLIIRFCVVFWAKKVRSDLSKIVSLTSNFLAHCSMNPENQRQIIIITTTLRGTVRLEKAKQTLLKMVFAIDYDGNFRNPQLSQYVASYMGFRFWAHDSNFDIRNHVKLINLRPLMSREDIQDVQQRLLQKPFNPKHSPWDITIVPNVSTNMDSKMRGISDLNTVIIYRFSHIIADGYSLIKMTESFAEVMTEARIKPNYSLGNSSLFGRIAFPFKCLYVSAEAIFNSFANSPFKVHRGKRTFKDFVQTADVVPIIIIKEIKNSCNVSFTSAVLSLATGAYRSLAIKSGIDIPETVTCVMPIPRPGHPSKLTNHFTLATLNLPVGEPDLKRRVQLCHKEYERIKSSVYPTVAYLAMLLLGACFNSVGQVILEYHPGDLFLSYLPLEWTECLFAGHELLRLSFFSAQSGCTGCGIFISTFRDQLAMSIVTESGIFTKEQTVEFNSIVQDEIEALKNVREPSKVQTGQIMRITSILKTREVKEPTSFITLRQHCKNI